MKLQINNLLEIASRSHTQFVSSRLVSYRERQIPGISELRRYVGIHLHNVYMLICCMCFLFQYSAHRNYPPKSISSAKRKYLKYDELKRIVIYLCIQCLRSAWLEKILRTLICLHVICPEINVCGFLRENILGKSIKCGKSCAVKRTTASSSNKHSESCDCALRAHNALQHL